LCNQQPLIQIQESGLDDVTIHARAQNLGYSRRTMKLFVSEADVVEFSANIVG